MNNSSNPRITIEDNVVFMDYDWHNSLTVDAFINEIRRGGKVFDLGGLIIPDGLRAIAQLDNYVYGVIEYPPGVYPIQVRDHDYGRVKVYRVSMPYVAAFFRFSQVKDHILIGSVAPLFATRPLTDWKQMLYFPAFPNCSPYAMGMCGADMKPIKSNEPILIRVSQRVRDCIYNSIFNDDYVADCAYSVHYANDGGLTFEWWARATETDPLLWSTYKWKPYLTFRQCFDRWTVVWNDSNDTALNLTTKDLARIVFNYAAQHKTKKGTNA